MIGFAYRELGKEEGLGPKIENNLVWIGLEGIMDPPRKGVSKAISECRSAGIRVIMMTGDNPMTARAISEQIGIESHKVFVGSQIGEMSDAEILRELRLGANIFARLSPENKFRIMRILKEDGNVVAMTGDGVNDALALKKADVGVSMGIRGTEVAKQASDLILLDDNFVTVVSAVKEGRRIFDNIRKFVNYLLTSNLAEVAVIFFATIFISLKEPILLPAQLLWINLLTDGFPALALGVDPARPGIMKEKPREKGTGVIDKKLSWLISLIGAKKSIMLLATFFAADYFYGSQVARTTLFTGFVLYEFVRVGSIRYQESLSWLSNKWLLAALGFSLLLQAVVVYTPVSEFFGVVSLGFGPWIILVSGIVLGYLLAIWITRAVVKFFG